MRRAASALPHEATDEGSGLGVVPTVTTRSTTYPHRHRLEVRKGACEVVNRHLAGWKAVPDPPLRRGVMGGGVRCYEEAMRLCLVKGHW